MSQINLSELKTGQVGIITGLKNNRLSLILRERGFNPGKEIEFLHSDLFQDVKLFTLDQAKFALRKSEYQLVEIELL